MIRGYPRGSRASVADFVHKIWRFVQYHGVNAARFIWTATADSILEKSPTLSPYLWDRTLARHRTVLLLTQHIGEQ
jgi:hypothetical protein